MHLELTQSTGQTESILTTLGANIVSALYDLAISGDLDNTSTVSGRLSIYAASKTKVEYLAGTNGTGGNGLFPNLYISCVTYYVDFLDAAFGRNCAQLFGDGEGVTLSQLQGVNATSMIGLRDMNNSSVSVFDFRNFPIMQYNNSSADWNCPVLTSIYINEAGHTSSQGDTVDLSFFVGCGVPIENNKTYVDKLIINTVRTQASVQSFLRGNSSDAKNSVNFGTIAIRNFDVPSGGYFQIGSYATRSNRTINNLYLGGNSVVKFNAGYGDDIFRITNIYVPIGMASQYAAESTWTKNGTTHTFYEYDFENDPDNIFAVFD